MWSKRDANLDVGGVIHPLSVGRVEVIELPAGVHRLKVRPEEGGLDFRRPQGIGGRVEQGNPGLRRGLRALQSDRSDAEHGPGRDRGHHQVSS